MAIESNRNIERNAMSTLNDLPQLLREKPELRNDLVKTLVEFAERNGISAAPEDFAWFDHDIARVGGGGDPGGGGLTIYRDGPTRSRWIVA